MGRITAREKVGNFLVEISDRLPREQNDRVVLPVSRYDIADCLGISPETVSRSLTDLKNRGVIRLLSTRTVMIVDRSALDNWERHPNGCHVFEVDAGRRVATRMARAG